MSSSGVSAIPVTRAAGRGSGARGEGSAAARSERSRRAGRIGVRVLALGYLALLLLAPVAMIFYRTFEHGIGPVIDAATTPSAQHAFWLSLEIVAIAVPLNTAFGIGMALLLERGRFRGKALLGMLIDLPFAISPVVVGLSLVLVYGKAGWLGDWLAGHGIQVIFSVPGMVLATAVVSLPFVVRETMPVLRELGTDSEQAAETLGASAWQTFLRVTLPGIRWGVVYGVVLTTARALGEFGAVSIVSGHLAGRTETLTQYVDTRYLTFDLTGAYAASLVLGALAVLALCGMNALRVRGQVRGQGSGVRGQGSEKWNKPSRRGYGGRTVR
jgi:sulfate/thiosulfate transport system permease protein